MSQWSILLLDIYGVSVLSPSWYEWGYDDGSEWGIPITYGMVSPFTDDVLYAIRKLGLVSY